MTTHELRLRQDICMYARRMWEKNFLAAGDGNLSVRLDDERVLITPSGFSKGFLKPEQILRVDMSGKVLPSRFKAAQGLRPSTETMMHLEALKQRPDVQAVVHAHPPTAIALTLVGLPLDVDVLPEVIYTLGVVPTAAYATPGTPANADVVRELIRHHDGLLLDHHGSLTVGKTLEEAYMKLERIEHSAQILAAARQLGALKRLPRAEYEKICDLSGHAHLKSWYGRC